MYFIEKVEILKIFIEYTNRCYIASNAVCSVCGPMLASLLAMLYACRSMLSIVSFVLRYVREVFSFVI